MISPDDPNFRINLSSALNKSWRIGLKGERLFRLLDLRYIKDTHPLVSTGK